MDTRGYIVAVNACGNYSNFQFASRASSYDMIPHNKRKTKCVTSALVLAAPAAFGKKRAREQQAIAKAGRVCCPARFRSSHITSLR